MKIFYRISDNGYNKIKPDYINNEHCLKNFVSVFMYKDIHIIADNCCNNTIDMIKKYISKNIHVVSLGNGAATFNVALDMALQHNNDNEIIYFVENDYLHLPKSDIILREGLDLHFSFVSLYDHPDKYKEPKDGGNPYCGGRAEDTRVYLTNSCHWKMTNSTTMTFAAKKSTLKRTENILRKWTNSNHPHDFQMFLELKENKEFLITSIPGYATHGEAMWLSPLVNWNTI